MIRKRQRTKMILNCREDLTLYQVLRHYNYNPLTGVFKRILRYDGWGNPHICDDIITGCNNRGYYWNRLFNKTFLVHRLIFLYMTGRHPEGEVDHIDGNRKNNKWDNLRDVNPFENSRNQGNRIDNTSGCRGVTYSKGRGRKHWIARISHKGTRYSLGYFLTKEEAIIARKIAEKKYGFHHNHALRKSWRI